MRKYSLISMILYKEELSVSEQKRKNLPWHSLFKVFAVMLLIAFVMPVVGGISAADAAPESGKLIVYYSWSGNTRYVAEQIQYLTGADIFELKPVDPYPEDFRATAERGRHELDSGYLPPLVGGIDNLADYEVIFIGFPNWFGTLAIPLFTFLESYDLSGKTIVPFISHGRGGLQNTLTDLKALAPNSTFLEELAIYRRETTQSDISQWLDRIGMLK